MKPLRVKFGTHHDDVLYGGRFDDVIIGLRGDDWLYGLNGQDWLFGGRGNDWLFGGNGKDWLFGGKGDDRLFGGNGQDVLFGGAGDDELCGGNGQDVLFGGAGNDRLFGGNGRDELFGGDGDDVFSGGGGNDFIDGGGSNGGALIQDLENGASSDVDWVDYSDAPAGVNVNLATGVAHDGHGGTDTLVNIRGVIGSAFDDVFIGSDTVAEYFRGGGGNDLIDGGILADLQSDQGFTFDYADYSDAPSAVNVNLATGIAQDGSGGIDTLIGIEAVIGSAYDDVLIGAGTFAERFHGGPGDDLIDGAGSFDRADYSDATGPISVDLGAGTVAGDASVGHDTLVQVEQVTGTDYADHYVALGFVSPSAPGGFPSSFNAFEGRGGDDVVTGNGNTRLEYTSARAGVEVNLAAGMAMSLVCDDADIGTDWFSGVNTVRGSDYADRLLGGNPASDGFESFDGRGGDDCIDGGSGYDRADYAFTGPMGIGISVDLAAGTVSGDPVQAGNDTLRGIEAIRGSYRDDLYDATDFSGTSDNAGAFGTLNDFEGMAGDDTVIGNGNTRVSYASAREGIVADLQSGDIFGGPSVGHDQILGGVNSVRGSNFDDELYGSEQSDILFGAFGNDLLRGGAGSDFLSGGIIADYQSDLGFRDTDTVDYSDAPDAVSVNLALGFALDGYGTIDGLAGIERVIGSAGNDTFLGSSAYLEFFRGGAGDDVIDGGLGFDRAEYSDATAGIEVDLALGSVTGLDASVGTDTLSGVEVIQGTDYADIYDAVGFQSPSLPGGFVNDFNAFEGRGGDDRITGNGSTRIEYSSATGPVTVNLVLGSAIGDASVGVDEIVGGVSSVRGSDYADTLVGGSLAAGGFESFDGRGGDDWIDGAGGFDRAEYGFNGPIGSGIVVDLADGTVSGDPVLIGTDTLRGIEAIRGTYLDDVYDSTGFSPASVNSGSLGSFNEFEGMAGNDLIIANGNTRVSYLLAREGVFVDLQSGTVFGGPSVGTDTIMGVVSQIRGSNFDDILNGTANGAGYAEIYDGRGGNDWFDGRGGYDQADYSSVATSTGIFVDMDAIGANAGRVAGDIAIGLDTLLDVVSVRGTGFADHYDGSGYFSAVSGFGSFNEFEGGGGDDTIIGNGNTRVSYVNESSPVTVDLGASMATGLSSGTDTLTNVFQVRGSNFDDTLTGSAFNDIFDGWGGNDTIDGEGGFDLARYDFAPGPGSFTIDAAGVITAIVGGQGTDTVTGVEVVRGTNSGDSFEFSLFAGPMRLEGRGGNDVMTLGSGDYTIVGGAGADSIDVALGSHRIDYDALIDAGDRIFNFATGPGGGVIDIADLLANWTSYNNGAGGPLGEYVQVVADGADALLQIDSDGVGAGAGWETLLTLDGGSAIDLGTLVSGANLDWLV